MTMLQTLPLLPKQEELHEVDCDVEDLEQVIRLARERHQEEEPLLDEIENINRL